jgi:hypothetical protein
MEKVELKSFEEIKGEIYITCDANFLSPKMEIIKKAYIKLKQLYQQEKSEKFVMHLVMASFNTFNEISDDKLKENPFCAVLGYKLITNKQMFNFIELTGTDRDKQYMKNAINYNDDEKKDFERRIAKCPVEYRNAYIAASSFQSTKLILRETLIALWLIKMQVKPLTAQPTKKPVKINHLDQRNFSVESISKDAHLLQELKDKLLKGETL